MTIAFIGLGVMGEAMCANLVAKSGQPVIAFDLNPEPVARLQAQGAGTAATLEDLVARADLLITCLPGGAQVRELVLGQGGLSGMLRTGQTLIDMSTSQPALMREIAEAAAVRGARFADAPIARTRQAAIDGTLAIMVGADDATFADIEPVLACMGSDILHCGPVGSGQMVKIMNNMVLFQNNVALAEALNIAEANGMDGGTLLEAMSKGSGDSFALRNHAMKAMVPDSYPDRAFSVKYALKDLSYAIEMAQEAGLPVPGAENVERLFNAAIEAGEGDLYHPVIRRRLKS
ncbi:NAD(P)-dependent oxidoreductase [Minwuia sp.]|uniref:NAD(P)-dependent oxidoreductase n=1 Tax=Minwuia sp. TaxID=2493630 RepID=UPI003A8CDDDA